MTKLQKFLVKTWLATIVFLIVLLLVQDSQVLSRLIFLPAIILIIANNSSIYAVQSVCPRVMDVVNENGALKLFAIFACLFEFSIASYVFYTGNNLFKSIDVGVLLMFVLLPVLPSIVCAQVECYKNLANAP